MNRKVIAVSFVGLLVAGVMFAHGGKDGRILGTVKTLHENHLMITSTDGHEVMIVLAEETRFVTSGDEEASRDDLTEGTRVVVTVKEDGKTAISVKIGSRPD